MKDLSLSSFLVDSPTKKQPTSLSEASHPSSAVVVSQSGSLLGTVVHFADSSRDSAVLAGVLQCLFCFSRNALLASFFIKQKKFDFGN